MKITVTFDSLDEFNNYMGIQSPSGQRPAIPAPAKDDQPDINRVTGAAPEEVQADAAPQETAQNAPETPAAPKAKPSTKKPPKPAQEDADAAPEAVTEDFRIEVRKQLAALNRKTGYNRAAELIKELTGTDAKLTEVALADLPKIMAAAKEEANAD